MNAIEHGNDSDPELPVDVRVLHRERRACSSRITDRGGGAELPEAETPDLEAKLEGAEARAAGGSS